MADMQIAVRLRRKPGHNLGVFAGFEVVVNDLADEIPRRRIVHVLLSGWIRGSAILRILQLRSTKFAKPLDFKHLSNCRKAKFPGFLGNELFDIDIAQLRYSTAVRADQELASVATGRIRATDIRIERIESVHQSGLNQKVERSVDGRRRSRPGVLAKACKNGVRTDRLVAVPDQLEDPSSDGSKAQASIAAE
jgi:hypothetical protein